MPNKRIASRIANWQTGVSREISWSPEREAHIARHGVTPGEVVTAREMTDSERRTFRRKGR
jgi:hypothetical protein